MKKLMLGLAPLLAVAAFAVMPAAASALTSYGTCTAPGPKAAQCPGVEKFTPFTEFKHEVVEDKKVSAKFILENEAENAGIECTTLTSAGFVWNVLGIGHSHEVLDFDGCKGIKGLAPPRCEQINAKTNNEIEGVVTNEVTAAAAVKITVESGFNVKCLKGGVEEEFGNVTGMATGTQTVETAVLKFVKAKGLKFLGENAQITGESETVLTSNGKKVYI
jgi:hypothetical protein